MTLRFAGARRIDGRHDVRRALAALGGEGTVGDVVAVTGLARDDVLEGLDAWLGDGGVGVRVTDDGDVTFHVSETPTALGTPRHEPRVCFDRKTIQLIRAREGVLSLAELIEHTGLTMAEARMEMRRLAERFGGEPHVSLDGHVVHAFPELMTSVHGRFPDREPRPAWVRSHDPMASARRGAFSRLCHLLVAPIERLRLVRFRRCATVRRYLLGLVTQTALAGKGVVSLGRAVRYVSARAGGARVGRHVVERALRRLATEFDAPITALDGDLFFGFRNVKRQFLASHLVRRELRLARTAAGETVFDSADPPLVAAARELRAFDLALALGEQKVPIGATRPMTTPR